MPATLTQPIGSAAPQLPGSTVLRVDPASEGGALLHDLDSPREQLHARFMLNTDKATGSAVAVAGGIDDAGGSAWQVVIDLAPSQVLLQVGTSTITADLQAPLSWQCIEVGLDATLGQASLRINGIQRATAAAALSATRHAWLGGAFAVDTISGTFELDHWILATQPIGVPLAQPSEDHAGDPRRWLVVYNRSVADSAAWADTYRDRRAVPYSNLCGLDLPSAETISAADYAAMRQQINDYLDDNHLRDQIVGVLLGFAVPGYADLEGTGELTPIASYLHTDDTHGLPVVNPLYQSEINDRPTASDFTSVRLTGRIDAPSLAEAIALIDRADHLTAIPLAHDNGSNVHVDLNPDNPNVGPVYTQAVADWAQGAGLSKLRLPATVYDAQPPTSVEEDAVVWGWRDAAPPPGFFGSPSGRRAVCMQFAPKPTPAVTLRDPSSTDWLTAAMQAGYAYAAAPSRAYSLNSLPLPHLVFEALRRGWTAAEAWLVAQPFLRDGLQLVGDPLMPIPLPKAGYDVFGPVDRLDQIDLLSPIARLHAGESSLDLQPDQLLAEGQAARYLLRRLDQHGRSDHAAAAHFVSIQAGQAARPALPAWPTREDWPVQRSGDPLVFSAYWSASLRSLGVNAVQLEAQPEGGAIALVEESQPAAGQRRVVFRIDPPSSPTRYRFVVVQGRATFHTPWSAEVLPQVSHTQPLTVLEVSS